MKKFFGEFKAFITRGNVLDMAVGVIVGSAFTAIVTALSNNILKPIINWILALCLGTGSLEGVYTFLKKAYVVDATTGMTTGTVDLANSIYIDWGTFINAVINFLIIAFVVFSMVKLINKFKELTDFTENMKKIVQKKLDADEELTSVEKEWLEKYSKKHPDLAPKKAEPVVEEAPAPEESLKPTTEELLTEIVTILKTK